MALRSIDTNSKLLLDIEVFSRRGTDHAAFLHRHTTNHEVSNTEFLVDAAGYLTTLAGRELSGYLDYSERNLIEKLFQTVTMRIKRLMDKHLSRRFSTGQYPIEHSLTLSYTNTILR